jgi:GT2 family glycosyltransferase
MHIIDTGHQLRLTIRTKAICMASVDISFVILAWNSRHHVGPCLESIRQAFAGSPLEYEILILDNGSSDGTAEELKRLAGLDPHVKPVFEAINLGTTKSRNRLMKRASGRYICVMDCDVQLPPGVMEPLIGVVEADPSVGMVVPRVLYPSGRWQKSFDRFPTLADKVNRFFRLRQIEKSEARQVRVDGPAFPVDYAISAFWLFPRSIMERVGLLDEKIFYAPEDVDYCLRIWKSGCRILLLPSVAIFHHTQEISRGFKLNRAKFSHLKGLAYFFMKHGYLWRRPPVGHASRSN